MLLSESEQFVYSSLGWVDGGTVWTFQTETEKVRSVHIGTAKYLSLSRGSNNLFSVAHFFDGGRFEVSIHRQNRDVETISRFRFKDDQYDFEGDLGAWNHVANSFVAYCSIGGVTDYWLFVLNPSEKSVVFQNFPWFDESYDKGYQGITGAYKVPSSKLFVITIQRDSRPVIWDPERQEIVRFIMLSERMGNPKLEFLNRSEQVIADDYDTLLRLDTKEWQVLDSVKLQNASEGTAQFIGNFSLNFDQSLTIVPRPFSGDVVVLNTQSFASIYVVRTGGQPLEAVLLKDNRVYARNWKTGAVLQGIAR